MGVQLEGGLRYSVPDRQIQTLASQLLISKVVISIQLNFRSLITIGSVYQRQIPRFFRLTNLVRV